LVIPLFIAIPLAVAFLLPLLGRGRPVLCDWLATATLAGLAILASASVGENSVYRMGGWSTPIGIDLRLDSLTSLMLITVNVVGLTTAIYSIDYIRRYTDKHHYYALFLLLVAGMNGVILAGDLFNLYVFMEIAAVASYALVAFGCEHEELEASFKYAVLGTLASTFILIGVALVYSVTGTLNMAHVASRVSETEMTAPLMLTVSLFICGFGLKAALVPFHTWLPDAHPAAPAPISAMLSGVLIKAIGIYVLARLIYNVFGADDDILRVLQWLGVISMVVGGLLATGQSDIKRLFAYSSISQVGYIVLGLGLGTPLGVVGALYHLVNHALFKSLLFLNAGTVEFTTGSRDLERLGGLNRTIPVTGATSMLASMSIAGIPPLNGFWSKLIIIIACVQVSAYGFAAVAVAMSIVTLAYQLKVQRHAFFGTPTPELTGVEREPRLMVVAMILLAAGCVALSMLVLGGLSSPYLIGPAADALLAGLFGR
jgi:multicomponent Na+:H+ antiporter subunit D